VKKTHRCLVAVVLPDDEKWKEFARQIRTQDPTFIGLTGKQTERELSPHPPPRRWYDVEYEARTKG
jgi:hypothetical protein